MGFQISPFGNDQFFTVTGALASGYKIFTYLSGTTQKEPVYTDINGLAPHTNPIILNSIGMPPYPIFLSISKRYKFIYTIPTDSDPPAAPIYTVPGVSTGLDILSSSNQEWTVGTTPTYVNSTTFTVVGNQSNVLHPGRRVKLIASTGTVYGTILTSTYSTVTTVTVAVDGGIAIPSTITSMSYGFLSADGSSWPSGFNTGLITTFNGDLVVPAGSNFNLIPPGAEFDYAGASLPAGYLWANGAAVSRVTYATLFGVIGTTYGAGDGVTTFNVPDRRGRMAIGRDNMGGTAANRVTSASLNGANAVNLGGNGGSQTHTLITAEIPSHNHPLTPTDLWHNSGGANNPSGAGVSGVIAGTVGNAGGGGAHSNTPPWQAVNVIVRYA